MGRMCLDEFLLLYQLCLFGRDDFVAALDFLGGSGTKTSAQRREMFIAMKLLLFGDTSRLGGFLHCALGHGEVSVNGDLGYGNVVVCEVDVGGAEFF